MSILNLELNSIFLWIFLRADESKDATAFILLLSALHVLVQSEKTHRSLEHGLGFLRLGGKFFGHS